SLPLGCDRAVRDAAIRPASPARDGEGTCPMTWLTAKGLLGLARGWWILGAILAAVALVVAFNVWLAGERRAAVEADRHEARSEALETARGADEAAQAATEGTRNEVERTNAEAEA